MVVSKKAQNFWTEFLETSSIHGLRYLVVQSTIRYQRIFWFLLLSIVSCLFAVLLYEVTVKYRLDQVIIRNSKKQYNISEIYHPALTFCLELKIFGANVSKEKGFYEMLDYTNYDQNISFDMNTFLALLEKRTQLEWFSNCVFGYFGDGAIIPLSTILTKHGFCFTFNMQPAKEMFNLDKVSSDFHYKKSFEMKAYTIQQSNPADPPWKGRISDGFTVIDFRRRSCDKNDANGGWDGPDFYDPTIPQYDEFNYFQPVEGILTIVHSPDEYPVNSGQNLYLVYWARNEWIFYTEMFTIDDELKTWPLEKRNCYLIGEKKLIFFKIYTKKNCEVECLSLLVLKKCGCVPFYLIRSTSTALCGIRDKLCVRATEESFHLSKGDIESACRCLERCEYVQFQVNAKQNTGLGNTELQTKFASMFFIPTVKQNSFGTSDYLGSLGGLIGLFAGISVISLVEVGFFMGRPAFKKLINLKKRRVTQEITVVAPKHIPIKEKNIFSQCSAFFFTIMDKSDIHGLHYIVEKKKSLYFRLFWLVTVLLSSAFCFWQITDLVKHSEMNPIEYAIDQKIWDLKDIPFPQLTFRPDFNYRKYEKHRKCMKTVNCDGIDPEMVEILRDPIKGPEEMKPITFIYNMMEDEKMDEEIFAETGAYPNYRSEVLGKLKTFMFLQRFVNQSYCSNGLRQSKIKEVLTESGASFVFNYDENLFNLREVGKDFSEPKVYQTECKDRSSLLETKSLSISVKDSFDNESCCAWTYVSFVVHNLNEFYKSSKGHFLLNTNTRVILRPEITTSDEGLRRYSPKVRNCYFSDEKQLKFFKKYSQSYCLKELQSILMKNKCGCVPFFIPRNDSQRMCSYRDFGCEFEIISLMNQGTSEEFKAYDCLPDCNSIDYNYEVINERMNPEENDTMYDIRFSASFYFGSDEFVAYKRFESYGTVELLSNIGGLLGLFLGLSVLSVIETIYFFTLRFFDDLMCMKSKL